MRAHLLQLVSLPCAPTTVGPIRRRLVLLPSPACPAAIAGSTNMSSLVVMSKGTKFTQQSYKVSGER